MTMNTFEILCCIVEKTVDKDPLHSEQIDGRVLFALKQKELVKVLPNGNVLSTTKGDNARSTD